MYDGWDGGTMYECGGDMAPTIRPRSAMKLRVKVVSCQRGCTARVVTPNQWGYRDVDLESGGKYVLPASPRKTWTRKGYLTKAAK